jgi:hypothetical protein
MKVRIAFLASMSILAGLDLVGCSQESTTTKKIEKLPTTKSVETKAEASKPLDVPRSSEPAILEEASKSAPAAPLPPPAPASASASASEKPKGPIDPNKDAGVERKPNKNDDDKN